MKLRKPIILLSLVILLSFVLLSLFFFSRKEANKKFIPLDQYESVVKEEIKQELEKNK